MIHSPARRQPRRAHLEMLVRVNCPHCHAAFDVANSEVLAQAGRIAGRRGGKATSEAKAAACRANASRPRPGRRKAPRPQ
jgi:predicted Zn finger-like uncharacterized protein